MKKSVIFSAFVALMTIVGVQTAMAQDEFKHEVAISYGALSNSQILDVFTDIVTQGDTHAQLRIQSYVSSAEPIELGSRHHSEVSVLVFANYHIVGIAIKVAFLLSIDKDSAYANPRLQVIEVLR